MVRVKFAVLNAFNAFFELNVCILLMAVYLSFLFCLCLDYFFRFFILVCLEYRLLIQAMAFNCKPDFFLNWNGLVMHEFIPNKSVFETLILLFLLFFSFKA